MSDPTIPSADAGPPADAGARTAIECEASAWIERRDRGEWDAGTQTDFDAWMAQSLAHRIAYWRLNAAWARTERLAALHLGDFRRVRRPAGTRPNNTVLKFAVSFCALALVGAAILYVLQPGYETVATNYGGHKIVTLSDGSRIELNTNSVIRLYDTAAGRRVSLIKGEAYFNIRHDAAHPFMVTVGKHRIVDLGTQFDVRSQPGSVRIALMEGRAEISDTTATNKKRAVVLTPGEVAVATRDTISVAKKPVREISNSLGWRRNKLIFYHTALGEAVAEFNRYNRQKLVIADPQVARLVVNGSFPTNGVDAFTQAAQEVFGLHVEHRNNRIVISR